MVVVVRASTSTLDLSYLHRTKSSLVSLAIEEALQKEENLQEVDVSASYIGKEIDHLLSLFQQQDIHPQRTFGIIAQRNQWTQKEATRLLETIIGPESEEIKVVPPPPKKSTRKKRSRKSSQNDAKAVQDEERSTTITKDGNVTSIEDESTALSDGVNVTKNVTSKDDKSTQVIGEETTKVDDVSKNETTVPPPRLVSQAITRVDLGWNDLGLSSDMRSTSDKAWYQILLRTIKNRDRCPQDLRFPACGLGPAACRAIAKGLMARYDHLKVDSTTLVDDDNDGLQSPTPISLQLGGNPAIGDPGVAALSAAIRTIVSKQRGGRTVLNNLDLSGCGITDTGAEALAIALELSPLCIRHLDLSNNLISNKGASALGRALAMREGEKMSKIETLDLSNNKGIDDAGAKALASAIEEGSIDNLVIRSCHVHADGAAAIVKSLRALAISEHRPSKIQLDLSGNPLGILRKKTKSGENKYSVSALKSKATATTAAYMSLIGKTVQKGLKDLGIAESVDTLESDDEEEAQSSEKNDEDPSLIKCGALAMADALLLDNEDDDNSEEKTDASTQRKDVLKVTLGLRHCAFDTRASEALAAIRQSLLSSVVNVDTSIDVVMNNILEEDTVAALRGEKAYECHLNEMAERYLEAMEALQSSRQRAADAAKATRQRMRAEQEMEDSWGGGDFEMGGDGDDDDFGYPDDDDDQGRDSDADYEREEDEDDFF